MYLALRRDKSGLCYVLRQSYEKDGQFLSRDLCDIGPDPSQHIIYPGGNSFYIDPAIIEKLSQSNTRVSPDDLEDLFWPFVDTDIKNATSHFRKKSRKSTFKRLSKTEKIEIQKRVHSFDKRRAHFLRFGAMDQGPVENMPAALFKKLARQSLQVLNITRDEFKTMSDKKLTRKYRKLAARSHPDTGGSHQEFIRLNDAYESLMQKMKHRRV